MKLELINFRCHLKRSYYFPEHQTSLLKGDPGWGKTTVFNSIWWVLYGSLRGVGHNINGNARTIVTLQFDQLASLGREIIIRRQNHPSKLTITIGQPITGPNQACHEGDVAQQLINRAFGSKDTWKAVSYIVQGEQCALLSGLRKNRLTLLEELSFRQDNPKEAIQRIDQQLHSEREKFRIMEGTYQKECQRLTQELSLGSIPQNSSSEMANQLEMELTQLKKQSIQEQKKEQTRHQLIGLSQHLASEIKAIQNDPAFHQTDVEILADLRKHGNQITEIDRTFEELRNKISNIDATEGKEYKRVENELNIILREKQLHLNNLNILRQNLAQLELQHSENSRQLTVLQSNKQEGDKLARELEQWIQAEQNNLSPLPPDKEWPTLIQLGQITQIEQERQTNSQRAARLGITYDPTVEGLVIQTETSLRQEEQNNIQLNTINKVITLRKQARELRGLVEEIRAVEINTTQDAANLRDRIGHLILATSKLLKEKEGSRVLLSCPRCGQSLSVKNGNLTADPRTPASPDEIDKLRIELESMNQLERTLSLLIGSWTGISTLPLSDETINLNDSNQKLQQLRSRVGGLRQVRWIPALQIGSTRCQKLVTLKLKCQERDILIKKNQVLSQTLMARLSSSKEIQGRIGSKKTEIEILDQKSIQPINQRIILLQKEKSTYADKLVSSPLGVMKERLVQLKHEQLQVKNNNKKLEETISRRRILSEQLEQKQTKEVKATRSLQSLGPSLLFSVTSQIGAKEQQLIAIQRGLRLVEWQRKLTTERDEVIAQQRSLADLEELRKIAERVEYQCLRETINSINTTMNQVFVSLFDDDITVELELFKRLKTNGRTKPIVNCLIHYQGSTYDQPSSISGGEKNRLNLGMILALNLVSSSPLILLDECTCFLNDRLRIQCMETVRNIIGSSKTIICVSHEDNEASYDNIIHVVPPEEQEIHRQMSQEAHLRMLTENPLVPVVSLVPYREISNVDAPNCQGPSPIVINTTNSVSNPELKLVVSAAKSS